MYGCRMVWGPAQSRKSIRSDELLENAEVGRPFLGG